MVDIEFLNTLCYVKYFITLCLSRGHIISRIIPVVLYAFVFFAHRELSWLKAQRVCEEYGMIQADIPPGAVHYITNYT